MGRGRGKGKKLTVSTNHDDPESGGEEVLPTYKRRGRPQKPFKDDIDEEDKGKIEVEEEGDYPKPITSSKDDKTADENGKKRTKRSQMNGSSNTMLVENGSVVNSSNNDDSTRFNNFRQNGSRRKSKPRRAAEAGVECE